MPQFSCFTPHFLTSHGHFLRGTTLIFDIPKGIFGVLTHILGNTDKKHSQVIKPQISRIYFYNYELHKFYELGEPWRLMGNHPDGAFAKKANNS